MENQLQPSLGGQIIKDGSETTSVEISPRSRLLFASRRILALLVDTFIATGLSTLPAIFQIVSIEGATHNHFDYVTSLYIAMQHGEVASTLMLIVMFTPIPLVYLRVFFKIFMHTNTPGESLARIETYAKNTGSKRWVVELTNALTQYLIVVLSAGCSTIMSYLLVLMSKAFVAPSEHLSLSATLVLLTVLLFAWPISFFSALSVWYFSFNRKSYLSLFDSNIDVIVKPKEKKNLIERIDRSKAQANRNSNEN